MVQNLTDQFKSSEGSNYYAFNETRFLQIHNDANICYQGFEGNQDLYGLGVRLCIYLQWIAALITNNLLPNAQQISRGTWLIFSIAMCIIVFVASFTHSCVFGIEMEILYWIYWGGFACVYASAPGRIRLGVQANQVGRNWDKAIRYTMHTLMASHGIWFNWRGYDQVFARMPCGTYQFIFAKFLDPSTPYSHARDVLSMFIDMISALFLNLFMTTTTIVVAAVVTVGIDTSSVYRMLLRIKTDHAMQQGGQRFQERNENICNRDESEHRAAGVLTRVRDGFLKVARMYYYFASMTVTELGHRSGVIGLITPLGVRHTRLYRIRCLTVWLVSFSISVTAIETTLAWNRVTSVHSLTSLGQMLSFIIGIATVISVLWELFVRGLNGTQDAKQSKTAVDDVELGVLPPPSSTVSGAILPAFLWAGEPFLTNSGTITGLMTEFQNSDVVPDNGPYMMSGGNGPGRQSMDTTSEIDSLTETDWETATEGTEGQRKGDNAKRVAVTNLTI
ncbi:uncharacterized protein FIESC28_10255 [Fusarium coffeatum]|uniref:Uncharacterized protein n=1 Tax=Fusarium coffeatum TaxID=231269 RepID=A0A366QWU0_9HYPO|nr:uncharacterized protein FIESC28_10255 [Fusarium coffeatum]RBR08455.1 hypothetical protein FIESC28_10255 [Fusarium coffeatum]